MEEAKSTPHQEPWGRAGGMQPTRVLQHVPSNWTSDERPEASTATDCGTSGPAHPKQHPASLSYSEEETGLREGVFGCESRQKHNRCCWKKQGGCGGKNIS